MGRSSGSEPRPRLRCAIYTRKSSDEGLDQDFNSLHAQREACEAYIKSQAGEGWVCLKTAYDDGGISGGTMERPGLKTLLADVGEGRVDVVVVYKVDRLTRSLHDFARIVEVFDQKKVSFVSVTQSFNTTSSMGRLTLNVLLSFAQFEREVTGERIRDKLAQSKAKGMWMGGLPPLGYAPDGRTLKIIPQEAELVRHIFRSYLTQGNVNGLVRQLAEQSLRSKAWVTAKGRAMGGMPFASGALYHLLRNPIFIGQVPHKGINHPGLHPAIIDQDLWDRVQAQMDAAVRRRGARPEALKAKAPLTGLIHDCDGVVMSPTASRGKGGKTFRYYVSSTLQKGGQGRNPDGIYRLPAGPMELWVETLLKRLFETSGDPVGLINRIDVGTDVVNLSLFGKGLGGRAADRRDLIEQVSARLHPNETLRYLHKDTWRLQISHRLAFRGGRTWLVGQAYSPDSARPNLTLVEGLRRAHDQVLAQGQILSVGSDKPPSTSFERKLARLAFLAPRMQREILHGRQPPMLTMEALKTLELPLCWADQVAAIQAIGA